MENESAASKAKRFFANEALSGLLHSSLALAAPFVATALTLWSGILQNLPLWLLIPFGGLACMSVLVTINQLDEFLRRRAVKNKIKFAGIHFVRAYDPETKEEGYTVALIIENMSDNPVDYRMHSFEAQLGDVRSREGKMPSKTFALSPRSTTHYKSGLIPGVKKSAALALKVRGVAKYGRRGASLPHEITSDLTLALTTNESGDFKSGEAYSADPDQDERFARAVRLNSEAPPECH